MEGEAAFIHPEYNPSNLNNDIALIRLPEPLELTGSIISFHPQNLALQKFFLQIASHRFGYHFKVKSLQLVQSLQSAAGELQKLPVQSLKTYFSLASIQFPIFNALPFTEHQ